VLFWGNGSISSTITTRYLAPGFEESTARNADTYRLPMPRQGEFRNLTAMHNTPLGSANNVVYTLLINGASQLSVSLAANATGPAATAGPIFSPSGSVISIQVTKPDGAIGGGGNTSSTVTIEFR